MNISMDQARKAHDFLICVDSDGCAMDTMDIKHQAAFGPALIPIYGLEDVAEAVLKEWDRINLYSGTRGINRFKGLLAILGHLAAQGRRIPGHKDLADWVNHSKELSNPALEKALLETPAQGLEDALAWSLEVNRRIQGLGDAGAPYEGVRASLEAAARHADVAVVSSANGEALAHEWSTFQLTPYLFALLGQEAGSKEACIRGLLSKGYAKEAALMVGDSPGDLEAAEKNGIRFFPILVGKEMESWMRFQSEALPRLVEGTYDDAYQMSLTHAFKTALGMEEDTASASES